MSTLLTDINDENLQLISRMQYFSVRDSIEKNHFLNLTRNTRMHGDRFGVFYKDGSRYMLVNHHDAVKPEGGLRVAYKVDKELWALFSARFPNEAAVKAS